MAFINYNNILQFMAVYKINNNILQFMAVYKIKKNILQFMARR